MLAALRLDGRPPTHGEARLAAAVFAAHDGRVGAVPLPWSERFAAWQITAVTALAPDAAPVWDGVRVAGLVLGALTAVLLWGVLHRLGCGSLPTALAVAVVGVTPVALALHAAATAAAVAVPWLLLAALLCWRGRVLGPVAALAAAVAVLTAPLLGAVLLALVAHEVAGRAPSRTARASRGVPLAVAAGVAAAGVAAAAAGGGPLAGQAAPPIATGPALAGVACGLVVVVAGWRVRWVRPLLSPALVVLAVLLVPGPGRAAAALTALVLLAVVGAAVLDDVVERVPARARTLLRGVGAGGTAAATVAAVAALPALPPAPAAQGGYASLVAWAGEQDSSGALVHADPLDRAELVAAGFPPERLRDLDAPVAAGDVVLLAHPRAGAPADTPAHCAAGTLLATVPGAGAAPAEICGTRAAVADPAPAERAGRARIGTALAANPGLTLGPAAADLLRQGAVDPRVMIVLAALTREHSLTVADFPLPPLAPPGAVRRQVLVAAVDGAPVGADAPSALRDWFRAQSPPYAPTVLRDDRSGLLVGYRDAAPPGLLPS